MRILLKLPKVNLINIWIYAVIISILFRLSIWVFSIFIPITNESGIPISPLNANSGIDLNFYVAESLYYKDYLCSLYNIIVSSDGCITKAIFIADVSQFLRPFELTNLVGGTPMIDELDIQFPAGPILPTLIIITNFTNTPWILSFIFFLFSSYLVYISIKWLNQKNVSWFWLFLYGGLPIPVWFMLNISPDLLFAIVVSTFLFIISSETKNLKNTNTVIYLIALSFISILLKPNGLSLFIFVFCFLLYEDILSNKFKILIFLISLILFILFIYFYGFYLFSFIKSSSLYRQIFGYTQIEYINGIYNFLPDALNKVFSWFSLLFAKLLYLSGLRPTFGETNNYLVLIRSSVGLIIFPGIIWLFFKGSFVEKLFVIIFLAPILLGLAQERYSIPIYPILFFYGTLFYTHVFKTIYSTFKTT